MKADPDSTPLKRTRVFGLDHEVGWSERWQRLKDWWRYPGFEIHRAYDRARSEQFPIVVGRYGQCTFPYCGCGSRERCGVK